MYVSLNDNDEVIIIVYVDDLLIGSKSLTKIEKVKSLLKEKLKMKDLKLKTFLEYM